MKKGTLSLSLENLGGLILAAVVIIGLVFFAAQIYSILVPSNENKVAIDNFEAMILTINQLVEAKGYTLTPEGKEITMVSDSNNVQVIFPYYLPGEQTDTGGYAIVVFDKEEIKEIFPTPIQSYKKPSQCTDLPCICLVNLIAPKHRISVDNPLSCETIKNVKYISTKATTSVNNFGEPHETGAGGNDLLIKSTCEGVPAFGVKNIKIIKLPSSETGKFNLYFDISDKPFGTK